MKNCRGQLLVSTDLGRFPSSFDVPLKEGQLKCVFFPFFFSNGSFHPYRKSAVRWHMGYFRAQKYDHC